MLQQQLKHILDGEGLTIYGASQIIGAKTDEPIKTIHERWRRNLKALPKSIADLEQDLNALGYQLQVVKKP